MSKARSVFSDALLYGVAGVVSRLMPLLLLPILSRGVSEEELGRVAVALGVANLLSILLSLGLNVSVVKYYHRPSASTTGGSTWASLLLLQVGLSGASAAAGIAACAALATGGGLSAEQAKFAASTIAYASALTVAQAGVSTARAAGLAGAVVTAGLLQAALSAVLAPPAIVSVGGWGYLVSLTVAAAVAAAVTLRSLRPRPSWNRRELQRAVRFSLPFLVHWLALWGLNLSDRLLVAAFVGSAAAGRYYLLYAAGTGGLLLLEAIHSAVVPRIMRQQSRATQSLQKVAPVYVAVACWTALATMIGSGPLLALLGLAEVKTQDRLVLGLVLGVLAVRPVYLLATTEILLTERSGRSARASSAAVAVSVALNVMLLPRYGLVAAGLANIIAYTVQALLMLPAWKARTRALGRRVVVAISVTVTSLVLVAPLTAAWSTMVLMVAAALVALVLGPLIGREELRKVIHGRD